MRLVFFLIVASASLACNAAENSVPGADRDHGIAVDTPGSATATELPGPIARLRFASSLAAAKGDVFSDTFRILAQRDIVTKFEVPIAQLGAGVVLVHFKLLNPEGVAHTSKWYAISSDAGAAATIRHPRFDKDMPVQQAEVRAGVATFYGKIPVAGTNFTRSRLHGEFTATLSLGANAAEPVAVHSFVMEL